MLKNILKIEGVKELSKGEQKSLRGGHHCDPEETCCYVCHCGTQLIPIYPGESCNFGPICDVHPACM